MEPQNKHDELFARIEQLEKEVTECKQKITQLQNILLNDRSRYKPVQNKTSNSESFTLENYVGLKLIHFVGIIVLIIGLSIGVKYAIDIDLISPVLRIILAWAAGILLLLLSYKLRKRFELFSMILFSGSMASLYFTTYAAFEYYAILPRLLTFIIMLSLTIFTVYTALKYNRAQIAVLALVGAYGIPFFVRGNSDNVLMLLSYTLLINLGVMFLSIKKYWPILTYLAFITTWLIYFSCIYMDDPNEHATTLKVFGMLFFMLFLLSSLLFKLYRNIPLIDTDSILLLFNSIFVYTALNILYAKEAVNSWAVSSIIMSVMYIISGIAVRRYLSQQRFLSNTLLGIGLTAFAAFIALEYEGFTITIIWLLTAILIFVAGMYFKFKIFRVSAIFLFAATLLKLLLFDSQSFTPVQKIISYVLTGTVLLIVSFLYQRFKGRIFDEE
jgi:uncharacterized membrane protein